MNAKRSGSFGGSLSVWLTDNPDFWAAILKSAKDC